MRPLFIRTGLGAKLSLLTGISVAALFLLFTFLMSNKASQLQETLAMEDLRNQTTGVVSMVEMFNSSISEEVESYTRLFSSFLPQPLAVDPQQRREISGIDVPLFKGGDIELHNNNAIADDFLQRTGAIATIFVRSTVISSAWPPRCVKRMASAQLVPAWKKPARLSPQS